MSLELVEIKVRNDRRHVCCCSYCFVFSITLKIKELLLPVLEKSENVNVAMMNWNETRDDRLNKMRLWNLFYVVARFSFRFALLPQIDPGRKGIAASKNSLLCHHQLFLHVKKIYATIFLYQQFHKNTKLIFAQSFKNSTNFGMKRIFRTWASKTCLLQAISRFFLTFSTLPLLIYFTKIKIYKFTKELLTVKRSLFVNKIKPSKNEFVSLYSPIKIRKKKWPNSGEN